MSPKNLRFAMGLSAALVFAGTPSVGAQVATETAPSAADTFERGRQMFHAQRFEEALTLLQQSLATEVSPNTLLFIGRSERALGRLRHAYGSLARAAALANERAITEPRYTSTAEAARTEAQEVAAQLAFVTVHVSNPTPGTEVQLNGEPLDASLWDQRTPLEPGNLEVRARAPERQPFQTQVQLTANQVTRIDITLAPEVGIAPPVIVPGGPGSTPPPLAQITFQPHASGPPPTPVGRTIGLVAMGVGGAGAIFGIVADVLAQNVYASLSRDCGEGRCLSTVPDVQPRVDAGQMWQTTALAALGAGSAVFLAGMILAIAVRPEESYGAASRGPAVHVAFDPRGGVVISGSF